jgi:hypothetical protein
MVGKIGNQESLIVRPPVIKHKLIYDSPEMDTMAARITRGEIIE